MKKLLIMLLLLSCGISNGQNLVPNGDFEQYLHCPTFASQLNSAKYWFIPTTGTSDYFNQCATVASSVNVPNTGYGFQPAHSGVGYGGGSPWWQGISNYREYLEVELDSALSAGACYQFKMYINSCSTCQYNTFEIGAYFSNAIITGGNATNLLFTPQISNTVNNYPDTLNWTLVTGSFNAVGGERYMIIGNFKNDTNTTTTLVNSAAPLSGTYFFIDDVSLTRCVNVGISEENEITVNIFPNPVTDKLTLQTNNYEPTEIILYDLSLRKLLEKPFTNSVTINTEQLAKGMYLYEVRNKNGNIKSGKIIKE